MNVSLLAAIYAQAKAAAPFLLSVPNLWTPSQVPRGTAFPFGVYSPVGDAPLEWDTTGVSVEKVRVQFSVYTTLGETVTMGYASQIQSNFAIGRILTLTSGKHLGCMPAFGPVPIPCDLLDASSNVVSHAAVDFFFWFENV